MDIKGLPKPDLEHYFKRLLVLNRLGIILEYRDGHTWISDVPIYEDDWQDSSLWCRKVNSILRDNHILLNTKIYGGILSAIDTIDAALQMAGMEPLIDQFDSRMYLGSGGVDESRIDKVITFGGLN